MASQLSPQAKTDLLSRLSRWPCNYPNIPQSLIDHASVVVSDETPCSLLRSMQEKPDGTPRDLDSFFHRAGAVLGLNSEELVRAADWDPKDLDPNRLDAMIAELRTVVFLHGEGFSDIRLLRSKGQKKADGTAIRGMTKYAVEVTCVGGFKYPGHQRRGQNLADFLMDKWNEKSSQLEATVVEEGCQSRVLVFVFVGTAQVAMVERKQYLEEGLIPVWRQLGCPPNTHLAVIAHSSDICVYPPW